MAIFAGGDTKYFEDNIVHFQFTQSVFDIAILAIAKTVILIIISAAMEETSFKLLDTPFDSELEKRAVQLHVAIKVVPLACLAFGIVKGALILNALLSVSGYKAMHATYDAACIAFICFSLLELLIALFSGHAMRKLQLLRVLHQFNSTGQELDENGHAIHKNPGLLKLLSLAKGVSVGMIGIFFNSYLKSQELLRNSGSYFILKILFEYFYFQRTHIYIYVCVHICAIFLLFRKYHFCWEDS